MFYILLLDYYLINIIIGTAINFFYKKVVRNIYLILERMNDIRNKEMIRKKERNKKCKNREKEKKEIRNEKISFCYFFLIKETGRNHVFITPNVIF